MTKYNQTVADEIYQHISRGMTQKDAATLVGVAPQTISEWKSTKPEFAELLRKGEMALKQKHIDAITFSNQWTAHAWWLERKYGDEFQPPKQRHESEVTHKKAREEDGFDKFLREHPELTEGAIDAYTDNGKTDPKQP